MRQILKTLSLCLAFLASNAVAGDLTAPSEEVVLTVTGEIGQKNSSDAAVFDMAMLQELPSKSYSTSTIWTEGTKTFVGVPLATLLEHVDAQGATLRATAINDYSVEMPMEAARDGSAIVAYEMDGAPMPRRQKGPLWIVYPYDTSTEYQSELIYSRSIWQLDRLEVVN